jgi:hypothetical protein
VDLVVAELGVIGRAALLDTATEAELVMGSAIPEMALA